jgi:hypothetical protein
MEAIEARADATSCVVFAREIISNPVALTQRPAGR